jgi:hypothetical protein
VNKVFPEHRNASPSRHIWFSLLLNTHSDTSVFDTIYDLHLQHTFLFFGNVLTHIPASLFFSLFLFSTSRASIDQLSYLLRFKDSRVCVSTSKQASKQANISLSGSRGVERGRCLPNTHVYIGVCTHPDARRARNGKEEEGGCGLTPSGPRQLLYIERPGTDVLKTS